MKLIVISQEQFFPQEAEWINKLMSEHDFIIHLRKPYSSEAEMDKFIQEIDENFYQRIVIHEHYLLAQKYNLKGIHLNTRNRRMDEEDEYWSNCSISRSCHTLEEVVKYKDRCNYVTLSPIFDSISKQGYKAAFTEDELKAALKKGILNEKVIALGGITSSHINNLSDLGFGGVAVLGTIWNHSELQAAQNALSQIIELININSWKQH